MLALLAAWLSIAISGKASYKFMTMRSSCSRFRNSKLFENYTSLNWVSNGQHNWALLFIQISHNIRHRISQNTRVSTYSSCRLIHQSMSSHSFTVCSLDVTELVLQNTVHVLKTFGAGSPPKVALLIKSPEDVDIALKKTL